MSIKYERLEISEVIVLSRIDSSSPMNLDVSGDYVGDHLDVSSLVFVKVNPGTTSLVGDF